MRYFRITIAITLTATLALHSGCHNRRNESGTPSKKIPPEQMIRLMADLELTESALKIKQVNLSRDSVKKIAAQSYDSLYAFYGTTPELFKENLKYYQSDIMVFQDMMDSVIISLNRHKDSVLNQSKVAGVKKKENPDSTQNNTPVKIKNR